MANVCIVEKYPSSYPFNSIFPFEFDRVALVPERMDKVLKRDINLDMDALKEAGYDYIILVGKEPCKFVADIRSVTEYQGFLVEDTYLAMLNPIAVKLNPSQKGAFDKSINSIICTVKGEVIDNSNISVRGILDEEEAKKYLMGITTDVAMGNTKVMALDTETSSFHPRDGYILGISIATTEDEGVYIDSAAMTDDNIGILQQIINRVAVLFFNEKFDKKMLEYHYGLKFKKCHDVMLQHYTLDENTAHGLKGLCLAHTPLGDYDKTLTEWKTAYCKNHGVLKRDFTYDLIPFEVLSIYAGYDAIGTLMLYNKFWPLVQKNPRLLRVYNDLLLKGSDFLQQIEENGVPISTDTLEIELQQINIELAELIHSLYDYDEVKEVEKRKNALFNVNSTQHVGMLFFDILGLPVIKLTETGNPSCDAEVLQELADSHAVASLINNIKQLKKIKSTYLDKMVAGIDADGRFRSGFNLHTTTSGRLSSSGKMNLQQLPRKNKSPKRCMQARPGFKIVSQDLKTAEMYVVAVLSGDKVLQQIFIDGEDYHGSMAVQKFGLPCTANEVAELYPDKRQAAKTISFEILYKLNYREPALKIFKRLKAWLQEQESYIKSKGFIYSFFGRKRRLADVFSSDKKYAQHFVRSGINFLVQSVSSDINLLAGIEMQEWIVKNHFRDKMIIWGLVHDSILAEVDVEWIDLYLEKLAEFTQKDRGLSISGCPIGLDIEVGQSYGTVKPI
jgi:DNA polymerase I-like protein with 3'-5' exonuclease and polymerase domains